MKVTQERIRNGDAKTTETKGKMKTGKKIRARYGAVAIGKPDEHSLAACKLLDKGWLNMRK